ncbi:DMT family transporter [Terrihabitans rhizophilus]|uniref:DMT family transporter n=1 Tax=Terrihabitans rhizophilus TaxID=3092662 RepID=A0ABU4RQC2_9HYPH|nr:DMT family transporter [Terrihabitans sp. PJ23]MDX6807036.1 DMT family transporter [Terrihabitans sp. PJ23]
MLTGIFYKIASAFCFTVMAGLIRWIGHDVPTGQIVAARSFFALLPILLWLGLSGELPRAFRTPRPFGHFLRASIGVASMFCLFLGLARLSLPESTMISYAVPLFTTILATVVLREPLRLPRLVAVFVGLAGVCIVLWPHVAGGKLAEMLDGRGGEASAGALFALTGAVLTSCAMIQVRRLVQTESTGTVVFYFSTFSTLFALLTFPFGWVVPDLPHALALLATGIAGGIGQILLTQGYRYAEASVIAPFEYTTLIWALAIGWLAFGDLLDIYGLVGGLVVVASGVLVILYERRLGIERAKARRAEPPPV